MVENTVPAPVVAEEQDEVTEATGTRLVEVRPGRAEVAAREGVRVGGLVEEYAQRGPERAMLS